MKVTLNPDKTITHSYWNGDHEEYKMINNAVLLYDFNNTLGNFMSIVEHVKPEFLRGAVKRENHGHLFTDYHQTVIDCGIVDIALVLKGYKPMCYVEHEDVPEFFDQLGLQMIKFKKQYGKKTRKEYIIYKDVLLKDRATFLANHIKELGQEDTEHHYIMADYLGYPKDDVDYFVYRK